MTESLQISVGAPGSRLAEQLRSRLDNQIPGEITLGSQLEESLWNSLSWRAAVGDEVHDRDHLFQAYAKSNSEIEMAREECIAFLDEACKANIDFRSEGEIHPEARNRAVQAESVRMHSFVVLPPAPADAVFNVQLTNEPLDKAREILDGALRRRTTDLVRQFLELSVGLVEKEVVGLVEWANPQACELFYFKRVIIQRQASRVVRDGESRTEWMRGGTRIVTQRSEHAAGEDEIRQARHEHSLHHAAAVPLDEIRTPIPQEFHEMMRNIPNWLRPAMRLITGVQFRGKIQEIEVDRKTWKHVRPLPAREEIRIHVDPVLALGPLVFAGWGEEHQAAENERLDAETRQRQTAVIEPLHTKVIQYGLVLFAVWQAVALVLVGAGEMHGSHLTWLGVGMSILGLGIVAGLVRFDNLGGARAGALMYVVAMLTAASAVAGVQFLGIAFVRNSLVLGLAGVVFAYAAFHLLGVFKKLRSS